MIKLFIIVSVLHITKTKETKIDANPLQKRLVKTLHREIIS